MPSKPVVPEPAPNLNAVEGKKPSIFTQEARKRAMELMLLRRVSTAAVLAYALRKWDVSNEMARGWIKEIQDGWRQEFKDDEDRVNQRLLSIKSLQDAIRHCHDIINEKAVIQIQDPRDSTKMIDRKVFAHEPKIRLDAMRTLKGLEGELATIAGFKLIKLLPEIPINPPAPPAPPTPQLESKEARVPEILPPSQGMGNLKGYQSFFLAYAAQPKPTQGGQSG